MEERSGSAGPEPFARGPVLAIAPAPVAPWGVDNDEEGTTVVVCRGPRSSWATLWPLFRHYG